MKYRTELGLEHYSQYGCIMAKAMGEFAEHSTEIHALAAAAKTDLLARLETAVTRDGLDHHEGLARHLFGVQQYNSGSAWRADGPEDLAPSGIASNPALPAGV